MRTNYRSIGAVVLVATTMILAACIPPPSGTPRPRLTLPDDIEVVATSDDGAIVTFQATGTFEGNPVPVVCDPSSASLFPIGSTTVECTATNAEGTTRSGSFTVTVLPEGSTTTTTSTTSTTSTSTTTTTTTSTTTTEPGPTTTLPPGDGPPAMSTGGTHTCAVNGDGTMACWGDNFFGQVGDGTPFNLNNSTIPLPSQVVGLSNVADISAGARHTCALRNDGQVFCWGNGTSGQVGNGVASNPRTPVQVTNMSNAVDVSAGDLHTCAVRNDGTVACWGDGFSGALGGSQTDSLVPRTVPGVTNAVSVSAGAGHSCAIRADGSAVCWGANNNGQLGNGEVANLSLVPVTVQLADVDDISAGSGITCATSDGSLYCWGGGNAYGQLGEGTLENIESSPRLVPNITAAGVSAGDDHVCVRLASDGVRCFGRNDRGQLGNGSFNNSLIVPDGEPTGYRPPTDVAGLSDVADVAGGGEHSCARRLNGSIACWGDNGFRQLGSGGNQARYNTIRAVTGF